MSARLEKIGADLEHAREKAAAWSEKAKELERRYRDAENMEIHDLVHEAMLTPDQLAEVLRALKAGPALDPTSVLPRDPASGEAESAGTDGAESGPDSDGKGDEEYGD